MRSPEASESEQSAGSVVMASVHGWTFTPMEQAYMREKLDGYNGSSGKQRRKFLRTTTQYLCQENEKRRGDALTEQQKSAIGKALRAWFKANGSARSTEKNEYGTNWYARLVFMRIHKRKVQALADEIVKADGEVNLEEFLDNWDSDAEAEDPNNDAGEGGKTGRNPKTKGKTGDHSDWFFNHYQQAGTLLISTLTEKQFAKYQTLAEKWNSEGPPPEVQAKVADKYAAKKAYKYLKHARKDYNCLSYLLLGWMGEDGKPKAVELDINDEFGWPKNFGDDNKKLLQTVFKQFRSYVFEAFETDEDGGVDSGKRKGRRKEIMNMERNAYGEPLLPDPKTRQPRETRGDWYCQAVRSFFIYHYAVASGAKVTDQSWPRFPWTRVLKEPRRFFSEAHLPDDVLETLKEPSSMTVPERMLIFNHLYRLQEPARKDEVSKDSKLFEMKAYIDRWGNILPRTPRVVLDLDGDEGDDEEEHPHPAKSSKVKRPPKKTGSKTSGGSPSKKAGDSSKTKAVGESDRLATAIELPADRSIEDTDQFEDSDSDETSSGSSSDNEIEEPASAGGFEPAVSPIMEESDLPGEGPAGASTLRSEMSAPALEYTRNLHSFSWSSESEASETASNGSSPAEPTLFLPDDMVLETPAGEEVPQVQSGVITRGRRGELDDKASPPLAGARKRAGDSEELPVPSQKRVRTTVAQTPTRRVTRAQSHTPSRGTRSATGAATVQASRRSGAQTVTTRSSQRASKKTKSRGRR